MEIESFPVWYPVNLLNLETKKISWKWRLKVRMSALLCLTAFATKQRKSPENGDWKVNFLSRSGNSNHGNKENLLKMEIERFPFCQDTFRQFWETKKISWKWRLKAEIFLFGLNFLVVKQRKSPENGDWKGFVLTVSLVSLLSWNKENLLKMEIERYSISDHVSNFAAWNKENLLKMEIERTITSTLITSQNVKQRKSPENGDWKSLSKTPLRAKLFKKQRKSPENGDWKFLFL